MVGVGNGCGVTGAVVCCAVLAGAVVVDEVWPCARIPAVQTVASTTVKARTDRFRIDLSNRLRMLSGRASLEQLYKIIKVVPAADCCGTWRYIRWLASPMT